MPVPAPGRDELPLVLLPGALLDASPELAARLGAGRRVLSLSYPALSTMTALTDAIAAELAAAGVEGADVLGSSYGGWVAQCLARRHPRRVRHLLLVHTFALRPSDAWRFRLGLKLWKVMPLAVFRKVGAVRVRRLLRPVRQASATEHARLAETLSREIGSPATIDALRRQNECMLESCASFAVRAGDLAGHDGRVLIVESDDDPAIRAGDRARLRSLYPGATVRTFHGTGHVTARAAPEAFADAVEAFLAAEPPRSVVKPAEELAAR